MGMNQPDLLGQLRIERTPEPEERAGAGRWIALVLVLLVAGAAAWWFFGRGPAPVVVKTASAIAASSAAPSNSVLDASGYVVARRQATVSAKVTGKVREVLIEEGMRVEQGQILATLDAMDQEAQVNLGQAQLESARSQAAEIEALLRQARADYQRQQDLSARKLTPASQLDAARAQADSLVARLASQRKQVDVAQRSLEMSQVSFEDTVIRAPFAGVVIAKAAQPGEMISPISAGGGFTRTGIGTIVDMDSLEVEVDVNEAFIGRVAAKMPVEATLNAYPDWHIPGAVIAVIPAADRTKATVRVRVSLNEKDARIVPDMGVRVAFLEARAAESAAPKEVAKGVIVPANAVIERDGATQVFVVEGDLAHLRRVEAAAAKNDQRNVLSGIAAGTSVIVDPPADLIDGARVAREEAK
jgi:RND family efflux transporter MFP subunit